MARIQGFASGPVRLHAASLYPAADLEDGKGYGGVDLRAGHPSCDERHIHFVYAIRINSVSSIHCVGGVFYEIEAKVAAGGFPCAQRRVARDFIVALR